MAFLRAKGKLLLLGVILGLLLPLSLPRAQASLYHFFDGVSDPPPDYPAGGQAVGIYNGLWGAQSFQATASYNLTRASLWVCDLGTLGDGATAELRPDSGGNPNMAGAPIATATSLAPTACGAYSWANFDFPAAPFVAAGTSYWVVLRSAVNGPANGWNWWNTRNSNRILPGSPGKESTNQGASWANGPGDFELRIFGYTNAALVLAKTVDKPTAKEGEILRFTLYFNNTGTEAASAVWINETLPFGLAYVSDNASQAGGTRTGTANWTFVGVVQGTHFFFLNTTITEGVAPGTVLVNTATLEYRNFNGAPGPRTAAATVTTANLATKSLHMRSSGGETLSTIPPSAAAIASYTIPKNGFHDWTQTPPAAAAFHIRDEARAYLAVDTGTHNSETLNVSLYVSDGFNPPALIGAQERVQAFDGIAGTYQNLAPFVFTGINRTIPRGSSLLLRILDRGNDPISIGFNSTALTARVDVTTDTYVAVTFVQIKDQNGIPGPFVSNDTIVIRANVSDPLGAQDIAGGRVNITNPLGATVVPTTAMVLESTDAAALPLWRVYRYSYGIPFPAVEGVYRIRVTGLETNGVADNRTAQAEVHNALLGFMKTVDMAGVRQGGTLTYSIYFNNTGTGTSPRLWINDTLPAGVTYLSDNATASGGLALGNTSWTFTSVAPGSHSFHVAVKVQGLIPGGTRLTNVATLEFLDPKGNPQPRKTTTASSTVLGPRIVLGLGSSKAGYNRAEVIRYMVYLNNTGTEVARTVDLNLTAPAELDYQSDGSSSQGGSATLAGNTLHITFSNLSVGNHYFDVNYTVKASAPGGIALTATAAANYSDGAGSRYPPLVATAAPSLIGPRITVSVAASRSAVNPGDPLNYVLWVNNTGTYVEAAPQLTLRFYLDNRTNFVTSSPGGLFNAGLNRVEWALTNVPVGFRGTYSVGVGAQVGLQPFLTILASGRADYTDGVGNPAPPVAFGLALPVTAPRLIASLRPNLGALSSGMSASQRIFYNDTGNGVARDAWVNVTLGQGWGYAGHVAESGSFAVNGSILSWHFGNVTPGTHHLDLLLQAGTLLDDGAALRANETLTYTDLNGNRVEALTLQPFRATALAPHLLLALAASVDRLSPGEVYNLSLTVTNTGAATAKEVWINDTMDSDLRFLGEDSGLVFQRTPGGGGEAFSWHLSDLGPGQTKTILVTLQLRFGTAPGTVISDYFTVEHTDPLGAGRVSLRSTLLTWNVAAAAGSAGDLLLWLPIVASVALASILGFVILWRRGTIEEILLVSYGGTLMVHLATSVTPDKDRDILTAMLTAIQDFIREAFARSREGELRHMDFGSHSIFIQRGVYSYLAVVLRGRVGRAVPKRMKRALTLLEGRFETTMKAWDGDQSKFAGAKEILYDLLVAKRWPWQTVRGNP